jgi:MoaA/NifB/PqqE/SkfB family radical SAM enzyme
MVSNLGKTLDNIEKKGMEKKVKEIAINAIEMGMDNEVIIKLTGLTNEEINEIRKERSH